MAELYPTIDGGDPPGRPAAAGRRRRHDDRVPDSRGPRGACHHPRGLMDSLRIAFLTSEVAPFAKVGGLADVSAALPRELRAAGHDVLVVMPNYARLAENGHASVPVPGLEGIPVRLGARTVSFSVRRAVLPETGLDVHLIDCPERSGRPGVYAQDADEAQPLVLLTPGAIEPSQRLAFAPDIL